MQMTATPPSIAPTIAPRFLVPPAPSSTSGSVVPSPVDAGTALEVLSGRLWTGSVPGVALVCTLEAMLIADETMELLVVADSGVGKYVVSSVRSPQRDMYKLDQRWAPYKRSNKEY